MSNAKEPGWAFKKPPSPTPPRLTTASASSTPISPPSSPTAARPRKWFLILSASILIVGLGFLGLVSWVMENDPRLSEKAREADLYRACQAYVSARLKAPSTAHFAAEPKIDKNHGITGLEGRWLLIFDVEAQNPFGVMLRETYACAISPDTGVVDRVANSKGKSL